MDEVKLDGQALTIAAKRYRAMPHKRGEQGHLALPEPHKVFSRKFVLSDVLTGFRVDMSGVTVGGDLPTPWASAMTITQSAAFAAWVVDRVYQAFWALRNLVGAAAHIPNVVARANPAKQWPLARAALDEADEAALRARRRVN